MESIVKYIECMSPTILPFERKQRGCNKNNYTLFMLYYFEYYSNISNDSKSEIQFDLLSTSDIESINESYGASIQISNSDESGKDEEHEAYETYNAERTI